MAMTLGQALVHAEQLEVYGVISRASQALIRLMQEYRAVVGVEQYEQIIEQAGVAHPDPQRPAPRILHQGKALGRCMKQRHRTSQIFVAFKPMLFDGHRLAGRRAKSPQLTNGPFHSTMRTMR
ncbi:hypothetical protein HDG32_007320 [Paraburkholderia sp. CI2]|uniref:hypothetical protein n=2 Tax=unclassified Paraburkholderia TaxID=2615204 RepID=UPI0016180BE1|nr:hypothetical protein [Paraburkholderia sp. CI2]MBB5471164.1 hypothetical protein [Paraburkholderia sp. CI2]